MSAIAPDDGAPAVPLALSVSTTRTTDTVRTALARASGILCVAVAAVLWLGPALLRDDIFQNDAAHHVFWLYRYADPELLTRDASLSYFTSPSDAPIGYRALYASLAPFVDLLHAAEWLSVLLLAATGLFAYLLGRAAARGSRHAEIAGLAATAITMALLARIELVPAMALQRAFAMPLTLLCLWALVARRYRWVGVSWLVAALVYPVVVPVLGLASCFVFLRDIARDRALPKDWIWNGVLGVAAIAIVLLDLGANPGVGPAVTFEQARQMPEFGPGGRQALFGVGWYDNIFMHHRTGIGVSLKILFGALAAGVVAVRLGRRRWIPPAALTMGLTGLALWGIARLTMFHLYLPNRHSRWTVTALAIVVLAAGATALYALCVDKLALRALRKRVASGTEPPAFTVAVPVVAALLAPLLVAGALYPHASAEWRKPVPIDLERAYAFIATLPKDTLVAAHPDLASYVPLRTHRAVLASTEAAVAFQLGYYASYVPRVEASLDAAYATDWAALDARLAPFGVDVMLSDDAVFKNLTYHPPFDTRVTKLTEHVDPRSFVLRDPPPDRLLFRSGDVVVVAVHRPTRGRGAAPAERR